MSKINAITMPKWGIEMQEGTINGWHATAGQVLGKTEPLLDVETEKIVNTVETPVAGTLRRIIGQVGDTLAVGALIGLMADAAVSEEELDQFIANFKGADTSFEPAADAGPAPTATPSAPEESSGEARVSPIARRVAERLGVDISKVVGTGRNGRVSKEDVEAYHAAQASGAVVAEVASKPAPADDGSTNPATREKMTSIRLTIARRLSESKQTIPHYRLGADVDFTGLFARRAELVAAGQKVSVNDLLLRGVALTLGKHPQLNAHFAGEEVVKFARADVCVAVSTDGGLSTPVLRDVANKTAAEVASGVADLAQRARNGKLVREEITGGTFTVSNLGMYGIDQFDAIINPPQVAILAVGAARERVIAQNGAAVVAKVATLTLSCDHRVVDGAVGAAFLADLRTCLENPATL
jgi:pyruvate dehydrogenase E2 component (dihydrolipoamide acetyltransferase)